MRPATQKHVLVPCPPSESDRHEFNIFRKEGTWVLKDVLPAYDGYQDLQTPFAIPGTGTTYAAALERAGTRAVRRPAADWRGRPHCEWVLDVPAGQGVGTRFRALRLGLFVRPERPGLVRGLREYYPGDETHWATEYVVEYEDTDEPWPGLKSLELYYATKESDYVPWRNRRFEIAEYRQRPGASPEREFSLSGYGLPEPKAISPERPGPGSGSIPYAPPPPPQQPRSWLWLVLLFAAAVVAVSIHVFRRWRAARETSNPGKGYSPGQ